MRTLHDQCFYGGFCSFSYTYTRGTTTFLRSPRRRRQRGLTIYSFETNGYIESYTSKFPATTQTVITSAQSTIQRLSDSVTNQNLVVYIKDLVSTRSSQLNGIVDSLGNGDLNSLVQKFSSQLTEINESLIRSGEGLFRQTEAAAGNVSLQLPSLPSDAAQKINAYLSDSGIGFNTVQNSLNEALRTVSYALAHPDEASQSLNDILRHTGELMGSINLNDNFTLPNGLQPLLNDLVTYLNDATIQASNTLSLGDDVNLLGSFTSYNVILLMFSAFAVVLIGIIVTSKNSSSVNDLNIPARYDPEIIESYFRKKPVDVSFRLLQVVYEFSSFTTNLLLDKMRGSEKENEKARAAELVKLITNLGPTSIKIGQALSIRPDLLPLAYIDELQKLQDRVPPFANDEAVKLIEEGLGKPVEVVFTEFSPEPVAAASLGQVYKARLRESNQIVAVKVQRPGVLEGICRDLYILRGGAKLAQSIPSVRSNLVALLDNWAFRFFDELDYQREGENALQFAKNMETLPNIVVPNVYMEYTSRKVLTAQWVEGEKLSESKAGDLIQLVKVAMISYLMQLLESGFLHADPHPGNLLRTKDGSLCILDYGLMTQITQEQQYAFIDYISHLVNSDYARVAEDLVNLGFVPPELVDPAKTVAVVPQLSRVLGELVQGGGARKVNFQQITEDLSEMSRDFVFVIPPYFSLILRAFSVLEGIGLAADPDYAILDDCYPYLCKRLLTDDSPRTRAALKYFIYAGKEQLDVSRAEDIISGFQSFQSLTAITADTNVNESRMQRSMNLATKEFLNLVFAPNGSYLQELLLTELVRIVDALSRDAVAEVWQYFASRALISIPPSLLAPKSWPIPLPGVLFGSSRVATLSPEDQQSLEAVKRLWVLLEPQFVQMRSRQEMREAASSIIPMFSELFPGVVNTSQKFVLMLLQRQALRLADDLDGQNSVSEWDKDPSAFARKVTPLLRGL